MEFIVEDAKVFQIDPSLDGYAVVWQCGRCENVTVEPECGDCGELFRDSPPRPKLYLLHAWATDTTKAGQLILFRDDATECTRGDSFSLDTLGRYNVEIRQPVQLALTEFAGRYQFFPLWKKAQWHGAARQDGSDGSDGEG